jgi:hypothetical protein
MAYSRYQKNHLINLWLLGEKGKPVSVCDADETLHFEPTLFSGNLAHIGL